MEMNVYVVHLFNELCIEQCIQKLQQRIFSRNVKMKVS